MEGVEILSEQIVYITEYQSWVFWFVVGFCATIGFLLGGTLGGGGFDFGDAFILLIPFILLGLLFGCIGLVATSKPTEEVDYIEQKVIVTDEVSMNEFYEKYDVIEQEGKIYTVRERD
jgi:hypothetical protein